MNNRWFGILGKVIYATTFIVILIYALNTAEVINCGRWISYLFISFMFILPIYGIVFISKRQKNKK